MSILSVLGGVFGGSSAPAKAAIFTIGKVPVTAGMLKAGFPAVQKLLADAEIAYQAKFANVPEDFIVAEDITDIAALIPIPAVQEDATIAKLLLMGASWALQHPSDALQPAMLKATGPDNVSLGD